MVVFPFKVEDPAVVAANLATAANHLRVSRVVAVGSERGPLFDHLSSESERLSASTGKPVEVVVQDRIGRHRPGKGDGMNTGLRLFLAGEEERLHFYDADITNFDAGWIDGAEAAADAGFPIVRHFFPRASTDAMITWMITRPMFAIGHPESAIWTIRQPLGGELLMDRSVVERLVEDEMVTTRSDWGIDTVLTYAQMTLGEPIYEHYVADGKQHALYGSLDELRPMVIECFEAANDVARSTRPPSVEHVVEKEGAAPPAIAEKVGFDFEATLRLLAEDWTEDEREAAGRLGPVVAPLLPEGPLPRFAFLDADTWYDVLQALRREYRPEPHWRSLLFRLWVGRVLAYTTSDALVGHAGAMARLERAVESYAGRARTGLLDREEGHGGEGEQEA